MIYNIDYMSKSKTTPATANNNSKSQPGRTQSSGNSGGMKTPFGSYMKQLDKIDRGVRYSKEYGSFLILSLVEEVGEMARAYLAKHGRKPTNLAAQTDETYEEELGDILVSILRFARIKKINLDERVTYSLQKIAKRRNEPKK